MRLPHVNIRLLLSGRKRQERIRKKCDYEEWSERCKAAGSEEEIRGLEPGNSGTFSKLEPLRK